MTCKTVAQLLAGLSIAKIHRAACLERQPLLGEPFKTTKYRADFPYCSGSLEELILDSVTRVDILRNAIVYHIAA